jgi:hypothetical protein
MGKDSWDDREHDILATHWKTSCKEERSGENYKGKEGAKM